MNKQSAVKILVVDDQQFIVDEISEFLEGNGYCCVPSYSGREALERFRDDLSIAIVLCDLDMPVLNGIELVEAMRLLAGKKRMFEAIMLTGRAEKQDVIKALRAGIADYYQKPVDLNELLEGIRRQEESLGERVREAQHLGRLDDRLQFLSASIDDLRQDLDKSSQNAQSTRPDRASERAIPTNFEHLSPRQLDVARLVSKGQTNYQIACELGITENTVKLYVSQVLRLTHMNNRTQLALALSPNNSAARGRVTEH